MPLRSDGFTGLIAINQIAEEQQHRITSFDSGTDSLNRFLNESALEFQAAHLGYTSVLFHEDFAGLVGYITLANDAIKLQGIEITDLALNLPPEQNLTAFPAIKIGRLAVHQELKRQGIGRRLLDLALGGVMGGSTLSAARILVADAINTEEVLAFYKGLKFEESKVGNEDYSKASRGKRHLPRLTIKMIRDIYKFD